MLFGGKGERADCRALQEPVAEAVPGDRDVLPRDIRDVAVGGPPGDAEVIRDLIDAPGPTAGEHLHELNEATGLVHYPIMMVDVIVRSCQTLSGRYPRRRARKRRGRRPGRRS